MSESAAVRKPMRIINFMGLRYYGAGFSIIVMIISLVSIGWNGLNFGLDFTGGTLVEVKFPDPVVPENVRVSLEKAGLREAVVQHFGSERDVLVRVPPQKGEAESLLADHVRRALDTNFPGVEMRRSEFVGPAVGAELRETGGLATLIALAAVMVYMMFRFTSKFGIGAVIALIHDVVVTVGAFSVFQWTFDLPTLAAVLAVIGYSVNDTVVVADRIRENFRKLRKGTPLEIINLSLTQTLDRTIMTSLTTLLVVVALFLFGGDSVRGFSIALMVGIVFGTYSSTYVAAGIVFFMGNTREDLMIPDKSAKDDRP
jgi:preprotein translocase subunit SecF